MFAIVTEVGSPKVRQVSWPDCPAPGRGEVLCRTLEIGICGTDREIVASAQPLPPPGEQQLVLGHECLAEVVEVGESATRFQPGDLVTPVVRRSLQGSSERVDLLGWGQYVERGIVHAHGFSTPFWLDDQDQLLRVPDELRGVAVLTEPQAVAEKAVNEAIVVQSARLTGWLDTPPRVGVTGMGPIAFACLLAARGRGWRTTVFGRDPQDSFRSQLVQRLGGEYQQIAATRWESRFDAEQARYDLLLETTGSESLLTQSIGQLATCGCAVWLAASRTPQASTSELSQMMRLGVLRNHIHLGSVNAARRDFTDALARLEQFRLASGDPLGDLITKRVAPHESIKDFSEREPQGVKVVLDYGEC